ncbi:hypothetical protein TrVE_jg13939 [Triparma verrucosa]|uniref:Uncharacterized protein n=1 Tax=Triparma verrucosa TaxID=1606542 RepID=A0A9W7FN36_9STRA|nr:hypothetical protein TrVE_jg13939 [Triparma verrucosa]
MDTAKIAPYTEPPKHGELEGKGPAPTAREVALLMKRNQELEEENMQLREENKKLRGLGVERQAEQDATHVIASAASSIPLKDDLEMLLVLLCEVMRPRKLVSSLPSCEKTTHLLQSDYIALARGFDFLSKTSGTNEDAVGEYFEKYPAMREMSERNPVFEELLVLTSFQTWQQHQMGCGSKAHFGGTTLNV